MQLPAMFSVLCSAFLVLPFACCIFCPYSYYYRYHIYVYETEEA